MGGRSLELAGSGGATRRSRSGPCRVERAKSLRESQRAGLTSLARARGDALQCGVTLPGLSGATEVLVRQRVEIAELMLQYESRNKYEIVSAAGAPMGFAAEQSAGFLGMLTRQLMGHWRRFDIHIFDPARQLVWIASHPFRFLFQRLEVRQPSGAPVGALQQRFGLLYKRFDLESPEGKVLMQMSAPRWRLWTFPFERRGQQVALVTKRWSGLLKEAFSDADNFKIEFSSSNLSEGERALIVAAALFIDLIYFETKDRT